MTENIDIDRAPYPTLAPTNSLSLTNIYSFQGFTIVGSSSDSQCGWSVSSAGDINGDGYRDVIVCTMNGNAYIIYGSAATPSTINLENLGTKGVHIYGGVSYSFCSVSAAGDINKDGYDDVIIYIGGNYDYVIYGGVSVASSINVLALGSQGISITVNDVSFGAVSGAGDVNGDGYDDIILGSCCVGNYNTGNAYIMYGNVSLPNVVNLSNSSIKSVFIPGVVKESYFGASVSSAGDINNDGFDDVIIGAYGTSQAYVIYGSINMPSSINLTNIGVYGFYIYGIPNTEFGSDVSGVGDINDDGFADYSVLAAIGIGAYVFYGNYTIPSIINVTTLNSSGFTISGGYGSYLSVSRAGNINGDIFNDFIIGTIFDTSYIIYGNSSFPSSINVDDLAGNQGYSVIGPSSSASGWSVSGAGDVNNDGYDDVIIGAPGNTNSYYGESYVIYGSASGYATLSPTHMPSLSAAPTHMPTEFNNIIDSNSNGNTDDTGLIAGLSISCITIIGIAGYSLGAYFNHWWPFSTESLASKAAEMEVHAV